MMEYCGIYVQEHGVFRTNSKHKINLEIPSNIPPALFSFIVASP